MKRKNVAGVVMNRIESHPIAVNQLQGIHDRFVFILAASLFCLRAALFCLLELEELAASQPCMNVFWGHVKPASLLFTNKSVFHHLRAKYATSCLTSA